MSSNVDQNVRPDFDELIREVTSKEFPNLNINYSIQETPMGISHAFSKAGGSLGTDGSVGYLFKKKGQIIVRESNQEKLLDLLISEGIEDIESSDEELTIIYTDPNSIHNTKNALLKESIEVIETEIIMDSSQSIKLNSEETEKVLNLIESLEDLDDVQNVFSNAEFSLEGIN